jgi:hypothetical protein
VFLGTAQTPDSAAQDIAPAAFGECVTLVRCPVFRMFFFGKDERFIGHLFL